MKINVFEKKLNWWLNRWIIGLKAPQAVNIINYIKYAMKKSNVYICDVKHLYAGDPMPGDEFYLFYISFEKDTKSSNRGDLLIRLYLDLTQDSLSIDANIIYNK